MARYIQLLSHFEVKFHLNSFETFHSTSFHLIQLKCLLTSTMYIFLYYLCEAVLIVFSIFTWLLTEFLEGLFTSSCPCAYTNFFKFDRVQFIIWSIHLSYYHSSNIFSIFTDPILGSEYYQKKCCQQSKHGEHCNQWFWITILSELWYIFKLIIKWIDSPVKH